MNSFNIEYQKEPFENVFAQIKVEIDNTDLKFWVCLDDAWETIKHADNFQAWFMATFTDIRLADIKFTDLKIRNAERYAKTIKLYGFNKLAGGPDSLIAAIPWRGLRTEEWHRCFNNFCTWTEVASKRMLEGYYQLLDRPDNDIKITWSIMWDNQLADASRIESWRHADHIDTPADFVMRVIQQHSDNVVHALISNAIDVPTIIKNIERQKHYVWSNGYVWDSQKVLKQD